MHQGRGKSKSKSQKEWSIKNNRMIWSFKSLHLIGNLVKVKHINHMTLTGVLATIRQSFPQVICLLNWLVRKENDGKIEVHKKVIVDTKNIVYLQWVDIDKSRSGRPDRGF